MLVCWKSVKFLKISGLKKKRFPPEQKKWRRDLWAGPPNKETLPKIEEDQEDEETPNEVVEPSEEYQRSRRNRIANRQYQDYEL